jgi:hypothetical protein
MLKSCLYGAVGLVMLSTAAGCAGTPAGEDGEPELVVDGVEWECRRIKEVGTRLGKKTCASPEQWAAHDKQVAEQTAESNLRRRDGGLAAAGQPGMGN